MPLRISTKGADREFQLLLLPSSSQRVINLHQCQSFVELCLCQTQLCREITCIAIQHFQITCGATTIAYGRESSCILCGFCEQLLLFTGFLVLFVGHQRVRNVAKRLLYGLLVKQHSFLLLRLRQSHAGTNSSAGKDRLCKLGAGAPEPGRRGEEAGQGRTLITTRSRENNLREIRSFGHADACIRRNQ